MTTYDKGEFESMVADKMFHYMMHVATREDISSVRQEIGSVRQEVKADIKELKVEIADLRQEVKADIAELRQEVKADIGKLDTKIDKMIWAFMGITGAIITGVTIQVIVHFIK